MIDRHPGVQYDSETGWYRAQHDWTSGDPISFTVLETIAAIDSRDPERIGPLYDVIDPDAIEAILRPGRAGVGQTQGVCVEFVLEGYAVTAYRDGEVLVRPAPDSGREEGFKA